METREKIEGGGETKVEGNKGTIGGRIPWKVAKMETSWEDFVAWQGAIREVKNKAEGCNLVALKERWETFPPREVKLRASKVINAA